MLSLGLLELLTIILASARLTRLATTDSISARFRYWAIDRVGARLGAGAAAWVEDLFGCPWCIGYWISIATVAFVAILPTNIALLLLAPWALSYAVGTIEQWNDPA